MHNHHDPTVLSPLAEAGSDGRVDEMDGAYLEILRMIEDGTISAEEGYMLLDALDTGPEPGNQMAPQPHAGGEEKAKETATRSSGPPAWAQRAWIYPLLGGAVLLVLAGFTTILLTGAGTHLGWLACTLPLMAFGGLVMALAWWSQNARWIHVRVRDHDTRFRISLPLPLRPVAWLARLARPWVPQIRDYPVDELILGLADMEEEDILAVEVNDAGEEVQVYLS